MPSKILAVGGWSFGLDELAPLAQAAPAQTDVHLKPSFEWASTERDSTFSCDLAIGWSLGGMLLLDALLQGTLETRSLLLFSSCSCFTCSEDFPEGVHPKQLKAMKIQLARNPEKCIHDFRETAADPEPPLSQESSWDRESLAWGLDVLARLDCQPALEQINIPVLLVHGESDRIIHPAASDRLHANLKQSELIRVPNAGHDLCIRSQYPLSKWIQQALHGADNPTD